MVEHAVVEAEIAGFPPHLLHHGLPLLQLFLAKATNRLGRISDGTTLLDHAADEIQRQITIHLGLAQFDWSGHKINLLDTPGYPDFVGDVYSALRVSDAAILLLRANAGVEVGTEVVWEVLKQEKTPLLVVEDGVLTGMITLENLAEFIVVVRQIAR